jgi:hypothetical protein
MGCSLEAFEEILKYLHIEQVAGSFRTAPAIGMLDKGCTPACIAHDVFSYEVCDCTYCSCESTSEILNTEIGFITSFYVDQIIQVARSKPSSFDEILSFIMQQELNERHRPSRCSFCGQTQKIQKICIRSPKVRFPQTFVISLTWSETSSSKISKFLSTLEPVISLDTVYFMNSEQKDYRRYIIRGMVTFYAQHYIAFFYSASRNSWVQFDDSNVRYIESWDLVVKKLVSGRMAPVLIFYEAARVLDQVKEAMQMEMIGNPIHIDEGNPTYLNPGLYFENWEEMSSIDLAGFRWGRTEYASQSSKHKSCSVI